MGCKVTLSAFFNKANSHATLEVWIERVKVVFWRGCHFLDFCCLCLKLDFEIDDVRGEAKVDSKLVFQRQLFCTAYKELNYGHV